MIRRIVTTESILNKIEQLGEKKTLEIIKNNDYGWQNSRVIEPMFGVNISCPHELGLTNIDTGCLGGACSDCWNKHVKAYFKNI